MYRRRFCRSHFLPSLLVGILAAAACDDEDILRPDPSVEPLVGAWQAIELILTPTGEGGSPLDVLATGATFSMDIQPSGIYTAYLTADGATSTEIGMLDVGTTRIVMKAEYPEPGTSTGTYELEGDRLTIEGQTETALGLPGTRSVTDVRMVFERP